MSLFLLGFLAGAVAVGLPAGWLVRRQHRALGTLETAIRGASRRLQETSLLFGRREGPAGPPEGGTPNPAGGAS